MLVTREPMDDASRAELEAVAASPTGDLPSRLILYGAFLLLLPTVLGGLIGTVLTVLGLPLDASMALGFLVGLGAGGIGVRRYRAVEAELGRELVDRIEGDRRDAQLERIELSPVEAAWEVEGFDDEGPAYLLRAEGDTDYLFLVSASLDDAPGLVPGETFPGNLVRVRRLPHSGRIVDLVVEGDPVPLASAKPRPLPFGSGLIRECEILPPSRVPDP